ncbi:MAG: Na+/H+ antiporter NhaA [Coriobacteriia bacterium]|nr:Na+/H+ antiporter NhaA [Coriobacteriia bacterium]
MTRQPAEALREVIDRQSLPSRLRESFGEFVHTEVAGAAALLLATAVALLIANSQYYVAYENFWHIDAGLYLGHVAFHETLVHWVNDALMALFFFVVGLEIKREVLVGELSERRKALLPILAALGGMVVPALIYLALNAGGTGAHGWGVPMATDIAFAIGVMALLGDRVPSGLKIFLVALAIADDLGAILVIAFAYTNNLQWGWLGWAAAMFVLLIALNRFKVDSPWPYFVIGGLLWLAVLLSGVHSTIAGVLVAITIPSTARLDPLLFTADTRRRLDRIEEAHVPGTHVLCDDTQQHVALDIRREARHTASPLQRLEFALHPWTTFLVLPLFALSNAGVRLVGEDLSALARTPIALGVLLGLVLGKPIGISAMTWVATKTGVAELPTGVRWSHILGAGMLGGIGFTMSLFVASIAFRGQVETTEAKAAILVASLVAGVLGYLMLRYGTGKHCTI